MKKLLLRASGWSILLLLGLTALLVVPLKFINPPLWSWQVQRYFWPPTGYPENSQQEWRDLNQFSPDLILAVIAAEDQLFFQHRGIDTGATIQAARDIINGKRFRGASTLSQQTIKNLYLWPQQNYLRKLIEAWLTLAAELCWDKSRMLELYLNIAEFGPGIYGAEAASQHYFNKPASQLNREEAARLAAVLPNPYKFHPLKANSHKKANWITRQMRQLGPGHLDPIRSQL